MIREELRAIEEEQSELEQRVTAAALEAPYKGPIMEFSIHVPCVKCGNSTAIGVQPCVVCQMRLGVEPEEP